MASTKIQILLLLLGLLLLLQTPLSEAGRKKKYDKCTTVKPVCQSDRFDVVFSHYDDDNCKIYKCQCRLPEAVVCPNGRTKLKADSHGCQYYDCISCIQRQACIGTMVSVFKGDDLNGCPQYACECPPNPVRPTCNSNEQLQSGTDASGCPNFFCNQVRTQCPERPTCSPNQELVAAGFVGECELFKCECVTPSRPACPTGSQPRLQDDGMGCPEYRCVENRSPCPPEPTCPSSHQVVSSEGMNENNCVKYVCRCIPLAPITCPDGYRMELETDESCGCQYYKCEPNCEPKPTCPSSYQHAVVTATRNNGCPSYSCDCKEPEVIQCSDADAVLQLTQATDGSNCEIYVCRSANSRSNCPTPACANPTSTGQTDSNGCPIFSCNGGNRNGGNCPTPTCNAGTRLTVTGYSGNCPQYTCQTDRSACVSLNCPAGQFSYQVGFSGPSCPYYICQPSSCPSPNSCGASQRPVLSSDQRGCSVVTCESNNGGLCNGVVRACANGETLRFVGNDQNGCAEYICFRQGCPQPPTCTLGESLVETGTSGSCKTYSCQSNTRSCSPMPNCGIGIQATLVGFDGSCPTYTCGNSNSRSGGAIGVGSNCQVPTCQFPLVAMTVGTDAFNCPTYMCTANSNGGARSGGGVNNFCSQPTICSDGTTPPSLGIDSNGCVIYGNCAFGGFNRNSGGVIGGGIVGGIVGGMGGSMVQSTSCPPQPECLYQEFRVRQQQVLGNQVCTVYTCANLGSYTGSPPKCLDNPNYCDATQTIETYTEREYTRGRKYKKGKKCQRIICKGSATSSTTYY